MPTISVGNEVSTPLEKARFTKQTFDLYALELLEMNNLYISNGTSEQYKYEETCRIKFIEFAYPMFNYDDNGEIESEFYEYIPFLEAYPTYMSYFLNYRELYSDKIVSMSGQLETSK